MSELVSSAEIADMLGVSERHIRYLVEKGFLAFERNARGHYRFDPQTAIKEFERYELLQGRGSYGAGNARKANDRHAVSKECADFGFRWAFETWWIARKELLAYPGRAIARLFDESGNLIASDSDSIVAILEEEACVCIRELDNYDHDNPILHLRDSCPYSGMRRDYACPCETEGGECRTTRQAFETCLVSPHMLENGAGGRIEPQPRQNGFAND